MRHILCLLFIVLLLPEVGRGQEDKPITIDLSMKVRTEPMEYYGKTIREIVRSYDEDGNIEPIEINKWVGFGMAQFHSTSDFSMAQFHSTSNFSAAQFHSTSDFNMAQFHSKSHFNFAKFDSASDFNRTKFVSTSGFLGVKFHSTSDFSDAEFHSTSNFRRAQFYSTNFSGTQFDSASSFWEAKFYSISDFSGVKFRSTSSFRTAQFHSTIGFSEGQFDSTSDFRGAQFDSTISYSYAHFYKEVYFRYTHFTKKASFDHLVVTSNTIFDFSHAILPDTIDFSHNTFLELKAPIDFTLADELNGDEQNVVKVSFMQKVGNGIWHYFMPNDTTDDYKKHRINLYNTDVSKIKINYDDFKFYAYDLENQDSAKQVVSREVIGSIYEGLLKNFKDRGQMDSYDKMDIEYQRYKAGIAEDEFSFLDWWWRYGHEKWRIFIHAVLLIFFFSIINFFILHKLNGTKRGFYDNKIQEQRDGVYEIENIPYFHAYKTGFSYKRLQALLKRFWYSLMYTSIIFFLLTLKIEKVRFGKPLSVWVMVIYTVGLVCMGFMANLILQK